MVRFALGTVSERSSENKSVSNYSEALTGSESKGRSRSSVRIRADEIKDYVCRNLIAVIEDPRYVQNIATVVRNVEALGVEKTYIVDPSRQLPDDWREMWDDKPMRRTSASAVKWSFGKRFDSTEECVAHLEANNFVSVVTSPHRKGARNEILDEADFTTHKKLAVWFGNESRGISDTTIAASEFCVGIPIFGLIVGDVAVAATVTLWGDEGFRCFGDLIVWLGASAGGGIVGDGAAAWRARRGSGGEAVGGAVP